LLTPDDWLDGDTLAAVVEAQFVSVAEHHVTGLESIASKRLGSPYRSGRSRHWIKSKNPDAPAVKREAEEHWGEDRRR
jgi:ATP-dependent DNA ligase